MVYLAQRAGLELGFDDFRLYHYGPYSSGLADSTDRSTACGLLDERVESEGDQVRYLYSVPEATHTVIDPYLRVRLGDAYDTFGDVTRWLGRHKSPVLEVAATAVYLRDEENVADGSELWDAVERLKGHLSQYFDRARALLNEWDRRRVEIAASVTP